MYQPQRPQIFYGWWMVLACAAVATVGWSLAVFGMGVYIHALSSQRGFSIGLVSMAVTVSFLVNAACLFSVGTTTARFGPKPIIIFGTIVMSLAVAGLGQTRETWQMFAVFAALGVGRSCLSATTISTTLAPWFEKQQGRAVSLALLGASVGGMVATPLLLGGIAFAGVGAAFAWAGLVSTLLLVPIALFVLKRTPQEMGLLPDGGQATGIAVVDQPRWTLRGAMATRQFPSQLVAFALAMLVQVGFLSHHVPLVAPVLGDSGASLAVSLAALFAFAGRIALARFADKVDLRITSAGVMLFSALSLAYMATAHDRMSLLVSSAMYGATIGNITTLAPLVARREIGALSFGRIYGFISAITAFAMAFGPTLYGALRDAFGSYGPALVAAAIINIASAIIIFWGGRRTLPAPF